MGMAPIEKKIALRILNDWRERFEAHEEESRNYAKQGYRNHYCVHGTNQWTDYDNICGPCEDGYGYWDYLEFLKLSAGEAHRIYNHYHKMRAEDKKFFVEMFSAVKDANTPVREAARKLMDEMMDETEEIIKRYV